MIETGDWKKQKKLKPNVVYDYNSTMGGDDKVAEHLRLCHCQKK